MYTQGCMYRQTIPCLTVSCKRTAKLLLKLTQPIVDTVSSDDCCPFGQGGPWRSSVDYLFQNVRSTKIRNSVDVWHSLFTKQRYHCFRSCPEHLGFWRLLTVMRLYYFYPCSFSQPDDSSLGRKVKWQRKGIHPWPEHARLYLSLWVDRAIPQYCSNHAWIVWETKTQ